MKAPLLALALSLTVGAAAAPVQVADLLANSPAGDWRAVDPDNMLYLQIPGGQVLIELAPRVAPQHVANIKVLARAHYFDGLAIVRVQDNYVVQWGDPDNKHTVPAEVHMVAPEFTADLRVDR